MKERIKLKNNHILKIWQDSDAGSPDCNENTDMFLVYDHRQFCIEREGFKPKNIYDYLTIVTDGNEEAITDYSNYHIFTVYAYIHSGVSLSLASGGCRFDTSSTGFILIEKNILQQGVGNKEEEITKEEALKYAESLIKEWNTYISGEVYGFTVTKETTCECCGHTEEEDSIDSCGGFYWETDKDLLVDMLGYIDKDLYSNADKSTEEIALGLLL